jgi:hypothetical protein
MDLILHSAVCNNVQSKDYLEQFNSSSWNTKVHMPDMFCILLLLQLGFMMGDLKTFHFISCNLYKQFDCDEFPTDPSRPYPFRDSFAS